VADKPIVRIVGFEMLGVRQRFPDADLKRVEIEVA